MHVQVRTVNSSKCPTTPLGNIQSIAMVFLHILFLSLLEPSYSASPDIGHLYPQATWNSPQQHWMSAISKTGTMFRFLGSSYANGSCLTPQSLLMQAIVPTYGYVTVWCFISSYKVPLIQQGKKNLPITFGVVFFNIKPQLRNIILTCLLNLIETDLVTTPALCPFSRPITTFVQSKQQSI